MTPLATPYLLFLGHAESLLGAKTASGIAHWRPEACLGQCRLPGCVADLGLSELTPEAAAAAGARTMIVGVATVGGKLAPEYVPWCLRALEAGLDLAAGLHQRLADIPEIAAAAARLGRRISDVRTPPEGLPCGTGQPRPGRRLLTVGTDCVVGKMFTALALERELRARGHAADFRATGQTGILIAGEGIAIDAVVADFISGAVEVLAPGAAPDHWDLIEGQGSLFHPAYAGVSLGLLHGAQAEALVLCHEAGRTHIDDGADYPLPDLPTAIAANLAAARLTSPDVRMAGIALNTRRLDDAAAKAALAEAERTTGLVTVDPVRTGVGPLVEALLA
ncbi:MAG: N-acetyltransferase DgcN [Pseudomonadota bacterium]